MRHRRIQKIRYEDLKKMGVVLKRARFFLTCDGRYFGGKEHGPEKLRTLFTLEERSGLNLAAQQDIRWLSNDMLDMTIAGESRSQLESLVGSGMLDAGQIRAALGGGEKSQLSLFELG
jgi:hypothetical protein